MANDPPTTRLISRYAAVILFVGVWMACGWIFRPSIQAYLLLGIPLTILFQSFVRRRPLLALWVREAPRFRLGWKGIAIALALAVLPAMSALGLLAEDEIPWAVVVSNAVACVGAVGAAYAIVNFKREHLWLLLLCLAITTALDMIQWSIFLITGEVEIKPIEGGILARVAILLYSLLSYVAITFVMEEVSFRMLDDHLHQGRPGLGLVSAVALSAMWGLWHLPLGEEISWGVIGLLLYVHVPYGVCLSLFWRRTGNLLIPALAHSLGDAIRNAIIAADSTPDG
jgi:membrane protease YdiL (CAAX protease family)